MSTTTAPTPSSERVAPPHKPGLVKPGHSQASAVPGQFAALLLLQADESPAPDTEPAGTFTGSAGKDALAAPHDPDEPDPPTHQGMETALLGLLSWRSYGVPLQGAAAATAGAAVPSSPGLVAPPLQATAPGPMATTPAGPQALNQPAATGTGLPVLTAESPSSGSEPATVQPQPSQGKGVGGMPPAASSSTEATGPRAKPGSARLALAALQAQSTLAGTSQAPMASMTSTVSLGLKGNPSDMTSQAARQGAMRPAANLSETNTLTEATSSAAEGPESPVTTAQPAGRSADSPGAGSGGPGADTGATAEVAAPDTTQTAPHDAMEQTMERLSAQVSYWATQGSQRANLTIAGDQAGPLNVSIAFEKGEINVHFETDEESVREALQTGAEEILNRLLEAKGMTLGSVSIGLGQSDARQAPNSQQAPDNSGREGVRAARAQRASADTPATAARPSPHIISASKLDFFA